MEDLIEGLLQQAYGEAEGRRIAGSYRLAALAVQLQQRIDAPTTAPQDGREGESGTEAAAEGSPAAGEDD